LYSISAPIEPPHRRSSLAFSQLLQAAEHSPSDAEREIDPEPAVQTPSRTMSNIGRKRALASPLARSAATPGHVSQMQRIFQDAKASLQLDAAIASSPAGSIASRLPSTGDAKELNRRGNTAGFQTRDWRYSTAPRNLAEADLDVREPFPTNSPGLPDHALPKVRNMQKVAREPMSSGFTSPVAAAGGDLVMVDDEASLLPLPTSSPTKSEESMVSPSSSSDHDHVPAPAMAVTELEQPMTKLHVSHVDAWLNGVLEDSPNAQREQRRRSKSAKVHESIATDLISPQMIDINIEDKDRAQEIILSTPAKAAAESAKLKRDRLGNGVRTSSNKENARPGSQGPSSALRCQTPTANLLSVPALQITPSPNFPHGSPPPSPGYAAQLPPGPPFRRVDSAGSPFPILKARSPPPADMTAAQQPWAGYYSSSPHRQFASPPQQPQTSPIYHQQYRMVYPSPQHHQTAPPPPQHHPFIEQPAIYDKSPPIPRSQQWIHLHGPPPPAAPHGLSRASAADQPYYSFSTAAAAYSGSSPAPDSRIRDAYRTDTLTPFEVPTTRFRKIGLGATAQARGARKYYAGRAAGADNEMARPGLSRTLTAAKRPLRGEPSPNHPTFAGLSGANASTKISGTGKFYASTKERTAGPRSPEEVTFRSSPPRAAEATVGYFHHGQEMDQGQGVGVQPRRKKLRRSLDDRGLEIMREGEGEVFSGTKIAEDRKSKPGIGLVGRRDEEAGIGANGELQMRGCGDVSEQADIDADDGTSSVQAVCGNERKLVRKKVATITTTTTTTTPALATTKPKAAASITPVGKRAQGFEAESQGENEGQASTEAREEEIRMLSPYVTPYRKGRGPKKSKQKSKQKSRRDADGERRASYWDWDGLDRLDAGEEVKEDEEDRRGCGIGEGSGGGARKVRDDDDDDADDKENRAPGVGDGDGDVEMREEAGVWPLVVMR
jgi:hypothetical protein